jgi:hypothetical protein
MVPVYNAAGPSRSRKQKAEAELAFRREIASSGVLVLKGSRGRLAAAGDQDP